MKRFAITTCLLLCGILLLIEPVSAAWLKGLGVLPGGTNATVNAISGDGSVAVGQSGGQACRWTAEGGVQAFAGLPTPPFTTYPHFTLGPSAAYGVSADGSVVVGEVNLCAYPDPGGRYCSKAFRWTESGGVEYLYIYAAYKVPTDVSADGSVVVGWGVPDASYYRTIAWRWTEVSGMQAPWPVRTAAYGVSADGSVMVGTVTGGGCRWTESEGWVPEALPFAPHLGVSGVSADGLVVVGYYWDPTDRRRVGRWTELGGMQDLGSLSDGDGCWAYGVSADGSVVVGNCASALQGERAFIWDETHGMRDLKNVLETVYGLDLTGWTLLEAKDVSDDGSKIVGQGVDPSGQAVAWIAYVGPVIVDIDIKPGSDTNCFNQDERGVIPVAILGTADLDVGQINVESLSLQGLVVKVVGKSNKYLAHIANVNGDEYPDLVVQFEESDRWVASGNGTATLTGELLAGIPIQGSDSICIVP